MNYFARISCITFILGTLAYAYRNNFIIIRSPWLTPYNTEHAIKAHKKAAKIWHEKQHAFSFETQQIIWYDAHTASNAARLISAYITLLEEKEKIDKKIHVQSCALNTTETELLISFSHTPFNEEMSIYQKWAIIEGLLHTVRDNISTIQSIQFLVQHQPLVDQHLDFSSAWPIEGFLSTYNLPQNDKIVVQPTTPQTIMLEPAGDAQYTGRIIEDAFERGLTLQCAQALKKALEESNKQFRIVLSRFPGEILEPLQNATFANRLQTNMYITISMYHTQAPLPEINIYYFLSHPTTDFWPKKTSELTCKPYNQAHIPHCLVSKKMAQEIFNSLQNIKPFAGQMQHCAGLPVKSLIGIAAPAIIIEIGLPHKNDWRELIPALAQQIHNVIPKSC